MLVRTHARSSRSGKKKGQRFRMGFACPVKNNQITCSKRISESLGPHAQRNTWFKWFQAVSKAEACKWSYARGNCINVVKIELMVASTF